MKIQVKNKPVIAVIDDRNGQYPRITIVVEDNAAGKYPDNLAFEFRKVDTVSNVAVGDVVNIGGYLGSRNAKGRWYTGINGALCEVVSKAGSRQAPQAQEDDNFGF